MTANMRIRRRNSAWFSTSLARDWFMAEIAKKEADYVLGTNDEELDRLGLHIVSGGRS